MSRLVVVSNRIALPDDKNRALAVWPSASGALRAAGVCGLAGAARLAMTSNRSSRSPAGIFRRRSTNERDHDEYYNQFSNAVLWPAFHYRLDLVSFQREAREGYLRVNAMLADKLLPLIEPDDTLWIHDYHLLPFASELRKRGVNNRIGFSYIFRSRRRRF